MPKDFPLVLHVDDEEDILEITKLALGSIGGLDVIQCSSGREALDLAHQHAPDLFLLDVMMPELDGIETLQRLRAISGFDQTPVIFMTAKATKEDKACLMEAGAASVITKPFDPMTVASEVVLIWQEAFQKKMTAEK